MEITALIELIVSYVSIWAPSIVAILGVVALIVKGINEVRVAVKELKSDQTIKNLASKLEESLAANKELVETNKILIDQVTRIQGYVDAKKRGG